MSKIIIRTLLIIVVVATGFGVTGCAQQGAQYGLRGYPNAPHQRVQPLVVDQNAIYNMNPQQFKEYQKRVNWATDYNRKLIRNDVAAANAAKSWTGNTNSYNNDNFGRIGRDASRTFSNELSRAISDGIRDMFD